MENHTDKIQPDLKCPFCKTGTYVRHEKGFLEKIGVPTVDGLIHTIYKSDLYICDNCNNIQMFGTRNPEKEAD